MKGAVGRRFCENELILELPTKSMPSGFRAAAIMGSLATVRDRTGGAGGARARGKDIGVTSLSRRWGAMRCAYCAPRL
jgi:hypothetical protein